MSSSVISKKTIYLEAIKQTFLKIEQDRIVSARSLIQQPGYLTVKYDYSIYQVLVEFIVSLDAESTIDKEGILLKLIKQFVKEKLVLESSVNWLSEEIELIEYMRSIFYNIDENKGNNNDWEMDFFEKSDSPNDRKYKINNLRRSWNNIKMQTESKLNQFVKRITQNSEESEIERFNEILENKYEEQRMKDDNLKALIEQEVQTIREAVKTMNLTALFNFEKVAIEPFGSAVSGFAQKSSDIDVSLNTFCYVDERDLLTLLIRFLRRHYNVIDKENQGKQSGAITKCKKLELVLTAQVPLIQIIREVSCQRNKQLISIDICINNVLGCANSRMLKTLSQLHPNISKLGIIIKTWGKVQGLIGKKTLSSYAFILAMFHFLFSSQILDDSFRKLMESKIDKQQYIVEIKRDKLKTEPEVFKATLYQPEKELEKLKKNLIQFQRNNPNIKTILELSLSELFIKFIDFYSEADQKRRTVSLFGSPLTKKRDPSLFFDITDPFDILHNPGDRSNQKSLFEQAFKYASSLIHKGKFYNLFSEKQDKYDNNFEAVA